MATMNKKALVNAVSSSTGLTKTQVENVVNDIFSTIISTVSAGDTVQLPGVGGFKKVHRKERQGHNPATGAKITIPASYAVKFTVSKTFKDEVNAS